MNKKEFFKQRIDKIAKESFNNDQKEIAKKIIDQTDENDLDSVWGLISQRVKTGFVFDEAPEINHNCVAYIKENEKLGVNLENKNALEHALIIGENYDALKNLVAMYTDKQGKGLVDVVYIDPPYNTEKTKQEGNDYKEEIDCKNKFIYRDKYTRDGWLNMMNERLKLAKTILSDTGVIFISIDDSEQAYLKVLCDEIFGESNFLGEIICQTATDNNPRQISVEHEYIICYAKNKDFQSAWQKKSKNAELILEKYLELKSQYTNNITQIQENLTKWIKLNKSTLKAVEHYNKVDEKGVYTDSTNSSNTKPGGYMFDIIHPITGKPCPKPAYGWRWPETTFWEYANSGEVAWGLDETTQPHIKKRIETAMELLRSVIYLDNRYTTKQLENILSRKKAFDNPKPVDLIKRLLEFTTTSTSIILDFFAGSGTTGQAVMELNEEDGGNRKFILVTNNENNIAKDITRERLYRIIKGVGSKGEDFEWTYSKDKKNLDGNSLRVFDIVKQKLNITEIEKAEKIKDEVESNFAKLKPDYIKNSNMNIYNVLSSLTPYKDNGEE